MRAIVWQPIAMLGHSRIGIGNFSGGQSVLNIGLLGAGSMGKIHAHAVSRSGLGKVSRIYSPEPDGDQLAAEIGAVSTKSPEDIFNDKAINVVIIASPPDVHAEHLKLAHASGKHILCEKPLVRTLAQADEIEHLFKGYSPVVQVGHVLHFAPEYRHLKDTVQSDALGKLGVARFGRCAFSPCIARPWFGDFKKSGGVLLDMMIHDIDMLTWCFGDVDRIYAQRTGSNDQIREDYCVAIARLKSGAIAHLEASWMEPAGTFYYYYEIAGSKGLMDFDSRNEPSLIVRPKTAPEGGVAPVPLMHTPAVASPYELQMESFLRAVIEHGKPQVTLDDGLRVVRTALAALQSSLDNQPAVVG